MNLTPQYYNINPRTKLEEISDNHIAIVKDIKSRIIRKDALKLVETAKQINTVEPDLKVSLMCNRNICSKSLKELADNNIDVIYLG